MLIQNLAKKKNWLFDLDNTLYSPNLGIFSQIDERMKKFISKKLELSETKSFILQKNFYKKYGTTLYGLMKHYEVDPQEFCNYVHNINLKNLKHSKSLRSKLQALPGRKIVYTNGDYKYAKKILKCLGIEDQFLDIIDITKSDFFDSEYYYLKNNDIIYVEPSFAKVKNSGYIGQISNVATIFSLITSIILLSRN